MDEKKTSKLQKLSGGLTGRQIILRFALSLGVAIAARAIYGLAVDDRAPTSVASTESIAQDSISKDSNSSLTSEAASAMPTDSVNAMLPADAVEAFKVLAENLKAKDRSKISENACGKAGVIVLARELHFYKWENDEWRDYSELIQHSDVGSPLSVTSADLTGDGTLDFLINFSGLQPGEPFVGGIFGVSNCAWNWIDLNLGTGRFTTVPLLTFDRSAKQLTTPGEADDGKVITWAFNSSAREFEPIDDGGETAVSVTTPEQPVS